MPTLEERMKTYDADQHIARLEVRIEKMQQDFCQLSYMLGMLMGAVQKLQDQLDKPIQHRGD